ncbi:MAG TPA: type IV toxin-antitoxin system AbiEi family antitoxin domain-containing protein [Sphingobium sp.]|nr:type IV toxin-antitoxin system AbiEi family antitoxin domain-containing protein [Sphingobium sp.]
MLRLERSIAPKRAWLPGVDEAENYEFAIALRQNTPNEPKIRKRDRDRAERLRLAGGPKPTLREHAVALARERGKVRTAELTAAGVPRCYLARMCKEGLLIKVRYGLYRAADLKAA